MSDFKRRVRSGILVDLLEPSVDDIRIEDIAFSLSQQVRFTGHCPGWTVALHSMVVAMRAPRDFALEALLHDASETYLGDVSKPLKDLLGSAFRCLEARFDAIICQRFDIDLPMFHREIKEIDNAVCDLEKRQFWPGCYPGDELMRDGPRESLHVIGATQTERNFLDMFHRLDRERNNRRRMNH